jgi:periplasmic protein TonB
MFDDFRTGPMSREERARMGGSAAVASIVYFSVGALLIGTTAATRQVVEKLTQVEFATKLPEPPPPPPPPPPTAAVAAQPQNARAKMKRRDLKPPDHVPDEKPKESDAPLANAEPAGPVDGFLTGVEGGTGTARVATVAAAPAPPKPETFTPPVESRSNTPPQYSAAARRKEIEGVVVVGFDVLENGTVTNVTIVSGPPDLRDTVLKSVATWHFSPARRGGKPVRYHVTKPIRFRLSDD